MTAPRVLPMLFDHATLLKLLLADGNAPLGLAVMLGVVLLGLGMARAARRRG